MADTTPDLAALAREVDREHNLAAAALMRRDMTAFHRHAGRYHAAATAHDAVTGGSIRSKYAKQ